MKRSVFALCTLIIMLASCNSSQQDTQNETSATGAASVLSDSSARIDQSVSDTTEKKDKVTSSVQQGIENTPGSEKNNSVDKRIDPSVKVVESSQPASLKTEAKKFCDFFKTYEEPSQFYDVPAHQVKEVKGKAGTLILVNPDDLTTLQNEPVDNKIEVELKELTNQEQLLKTNAQTVCNGKLLVSGGAYYINLKSEGKPLKLKSGKSLSVKFPKLTDAPMTLFAGYRDSLGQMQWQQRKQVFRADPLQGAWRDTRNMAIQYDGDILEIDTFPKRKKKEKTETEKKVDEAYDKVYAAMDIQSLGWINCDRFYNIPDKTNLSINIQGREAIPFASIYLVFDGMNSVMQTHYGSTAKGVSNPGFENIPVGAKVRLVAFSLKDDKLLAYSSDIIIKKNETVAVALKEISEEELKKMLSKN